MIRKLPRESHENIPQSSKNAFISYKDNLILIKKKHSSLTSTSPSIVLESWWTLANVRAWGVYAYSEWIADSSEQSTFIDVLTHKSALSFVTWFADTSEIVKIIKG